MKYFILACSIVMLSIQVKAQAKPKVLGLGNIVSDAASVNQELGSKLGLPAIKESVNVIEIRLYSGIGFPETQCVVLQYDKTWKATKWKLNAKDSVFKSTLKPATNIESIVKAMVASNIFSLPAQDKINSGNYTLELSTGKIKMSALTINDAACYYIQFKVGDSFREYKYCEPKQYATFYKEQHEYADFTNILNAFAKLQLK
ncbi:MAG: hypothetical protein V4506_16845 [Bacteroidota bacterium]